MLTLYSEAHISENIILSTCNRTEIFAVVEHIEWGKQDIIRFLNEWFDISEAELTEYLYISSGEKSVRHTFKLAVGLESMV